MRRVIDSIIALQLIGEPVIDDIRLVTFAGLSGARVGVDLLGLVDARHIMSQIPVEIEDIIALERGAVLPVSRVACQRNFFGAVVVAVVNAIPLDQLDAGDEFVDQNNVGRALVILVLGLDHKIHRQRHDLHIEGGHVGGAGLPAQAHGCISLGGILNVQLHDIIAHFEEAVAIVAYATGRFQGNLVILRSDGHGLVADGGVHRQFSHHLLEKACVIGVLGGAVVQGLNTVKRRYDIAVQRDHGLSLVPEGGNLDAVVVFLRPGDARDSDGVGARLKVGHDNIARSDTVKTNRAVGNLRLILPDHFVIHGNRVDILRFLALAKRQRQRFDRGDGQGSFGGVDQAGFGRHRGAGAFDLVDHAGRVRGQLRRVLDVIGVFGAVRFVVISDRSHGHRVFAGGGIRPAGQFGRVNVAGLRVFSGEVDVGATNVERDDRIHFRAVDVDRIHVQSADLAKILAVIARGRVHSKHRHLAGSLRDVKAHIRIGQIGRSDAGILIRHPGKLYGICAGLQAARVHTDIVRAIDSGIGNVHNLGFAPVNLVGNSDRIEFPRFAAVGEMAQDAIRGTHIFIDQVFRRHRRQFARRGADGDGGKAIQIDGGIFNIVIGIIHRNRHKVICVGVRGRDFRTGFFSRSASLIGIGACDGRHNVVDRFGRNREDRLFRAGIGQLTRCGGNRHRGRGLCDGRLRIKGRNGCIHNIGVGHALGIVIL